MSAPDNLEEVATSNEDSGVVRGRGRGKGTGRKRRGVGVGGVGRDSSLVTRHGGGGGGGKRGVEKRAGGVERARGLGSVSLPLSVSGNDDSDESYSEE
jgi:hypothetical protein